MTTWIDLSAHNLALWRVGPDEAGIRRYLLHPIFPDVPHTPPDALALDVDLPWNPEVGGYWLPIKLGRDKLPSRARWLEAFCGALFRDMGDAARVPTFAVAQRNLAELLSLPLPSPWVWSNNEHPERFFANEEQAIADGAGAAIVRADHEIIPQGIQVLHPVTVDALDDAISGVPDGQPSSEEESPALGANETPGADTAPEADAAGDEGEPDRRRDYGERVAGARKQSDRELVSQEIARYGAVVHATKIHNSVVLDTVVRATRRDALWGPLAQRLERPEVADSPWKRAIWSFLYQTVPASVRSARWEQKKRHGGPSDEITYMRVIAYIEILRVIEARMDALPAAPTGADLFALLNGDPFLLDDGPRDNRPGHASRLLSWFPERNWVHEQIVPNLVTAAYGDDDARQRYAALITDLPGGLKVLVDGITKPSSTPFARAMIQEWNRGFWGTGEFFGTTRSLMEPARAAFQEPSASLRAVVDRYHAWATVFYSQHPLMLGFSYDEEPTPEQITAMIHQKTQECEEAIKDGRFLDMYRQFLWGRDGSLMPERALQREVSIALFDHYRTIVETVAAQVAQSPAPLVPAEEGAPDVEGPETAAPPPAEDDPGALFIRWETQKPLPPATWISTGYRQGPPTARGTQDIDEQTLCATFGLRAVQYGNWMTQKDRQEHLNAAYDSLSDIAFLMDFPDLRMVGLPRKIPGDTRQPLALALGARGRGGKVVAHYEGLQHVINMTKTRGAGAVLHEWTHALDNFMGCEETGGAMVFASSLTESSNPVHDFVKKTLCQPLSQKDQREVEFQINRAHDEMAQCVRRGLLSTQVQTRIFSQIQRWQRGPDGQAADSALVQDLFVAWLPRMVQATEQIIAGARQPFEDWLARKTASEFKAIPIDYKAILIDHLVYPFYQNKRKHIWSYNEQEALNTLRTHMGLEERDPEQHAADRERLMAYDKDTRNAVSAEIAIPAFWANGVTQSIWKELIDPILNQKSPYDRSGSTAHTTSRYLQEAKRLDGQKEGSSRRTSSRRLYWSTPHELFARAVAAAGFDRLAETGVENSYLSDSRPLTDEEMGKYRGVRDPVGAERAHFTQTFFQGPLLPIVRQKLEVAIAEAPVLSDTASPEDTSNETSQAAEMG